MKKSIVLTSMFALFAGATMAQEVPFVVKNKQDVSYSDIVYTNNTGIIAPVVDVNAGGKLALDNVNFSGNSVSVPTIYEALIKVYTSANLTLTNSQFNNNVATHSSTPNGDVSGSVLNFTIGNTGGATDVGIVNIENTVFDSNSVYTTRQAFGNIYASNPVQANFKNVTISNNIAGDSSTMCAYSAGLCAYGIGHTTIADSTFSNNIATSYYWTDGGALYARAILSTWRNYDVSLSISNSTFEGNAAILKASETPRMDNDSRASGGAIYIRSSEVNPTTYAAEISNTTFKNNYVSVDQNITDTLTAQSGGGAIFVDANGVKISATRDITNVGNYVSYKGVLDDSKGGFIYLNSRTNQGNPVVAEFAISEGATYTIGDGTAGYDSVAGDASSTINKTGAGALVVNGSMEYFKGVLNVNEGSMVVNSVLGASDVVVASGATLTLGDNADIILYGCSITVAEGATLELGANSNIIVNLEEDFTGTTSLFNIADGATLTQGGESVSLSGLTDNITITYMGETIDESRWSIDATTGELVAKVVVPEPAEWAMILGALALGVAIYRRRK